ncbi:MAG: YceI family protein [Pseudomonadota bacterium]
MKKHLYLSALLAVGCMAPAFAAQRVVADSAQLQFSFKQTGVPGEGRFRRFTPEVSFDVSKPELASIRVEVDVSSLELGDSGWSRDLQGHDWFDAAQFAKAVFTAAGARSLGEGKYEAPGRLVIKGVGRDVTAAFTAKKAGDTTTIEGVIPVKRLAFGVGAGPWSDVGMVADDVVIRFRLALAGS